MQSPPPRAVISVHPAIGPARRVEFADAVEVGRDMSDPDVRVDDRMVSRRHLRLTATDEGLLVEDLGSANGTAIDGAPVSHPALAAPGSRIGLGRSAIDVLTIDGAAAAVPPAPDAGSEAQPGRGLERIANEAAVVWFRPGSAAARFAPGVLEQAAAARRRLRGLGSEAWSGPSTIVLADPFPDPGRPTDAVVSGSVVDVERHQIWSVATAESPPEHPARPLALLFGAALPAADELDAVLEGFGYIVAGVGDPSDHLRSVDIPPIDETRGPLRSAVCTSFVRYLLDREGEAGLKSYIGSCRPGAIDDAAREVYGLSTAELEQAWRRTVRQPDERVPTSQFLRMSIRYLRPHAWRQLEIGIYMVLSLAFTLAYPFISRRLFDSAIPSGEFSRVLGLLGLLGAAFAVTLVAGLRRAYVSATVSASVTMEVRRQMFHRLQQLDARWFHDHQQGDVLSRMFSDVGVVQKGLSETLSEGLFQVLTLVVSAVVMLTLDPLLGAIVLVGAPLVALVYRVMGEGARTRSLAVQEQSSHLLSVTAENHAGRDVVRSFGLAPREEDRFDRAARRLFRNQLRLRLYGGIFGLSVQSIVTVLRLFILGLGSWLILEGRFTLGGLVAFLGIMGEVISPITVLTNLGQQLQAATGALQRVNEVLEAEPAIDDGPSSRDVNSVEREIRLDDVTFSYDGAHPTLRNLSLTIPAGANAAIVGPSGSGKSTVLRLLMRMYDPDRGTVLVDGTDLRSVSLASHRDLLGVVFQDNFLFTTTVAENIALGTDDASRQQVRAAAEAAEIDEFIDALPRGYETLVGERGSLLSGGQRQRVAIARALIRDPDVLLLDEATSALDARTERQINATLERVSVGRTTISVTHRLTSVTNHDVIFVLVDGHLAEEGTHEQLLDAGGVYAGLWQEQTGQPVAVLPRHDIAGALASAWLFSELDAPALADIAAGVVVAPIASGAVIDVADGGLVVVLDGTAAVTKPGVGGDVVVARLSAGQLFGIEALMTGAVDTTMRMTADGHVGRLDAGAIRRAAATYPSVAAALDSGGRSGPGPTGGFRLAPATAGRVPIVSPGSPSELDVTSDSGPRGGPR